MNSANIGIDTALPSNICILETLWKGQTFVLKQNSRTNGKKRRRTLNDRTENFFPHFTVLSSAKRPSAKQNGKWPGMMEAFICLSISNRFPFISICVQAATISLSLHSAQNNQTLQRIDCPCYRFSLLLRSFVPSSSVLVCMLFLQCYAASNYVILQSRTVFAFMRSLCDGSERIFATLLLMQSE